MRAGIWIAMALTVLGAGTALADPAIYTLTGMSTGVEGSSKCATYQVTIDPSVEGKVVKGSFKQQGRPERKFAATLDAKGNFVAKVDLSNGNHMDVSGSISPDDSRILLDGYCKFGGKLSRTK